MRDQELEVWINKLKATINTKDAKIGMKYFFMSVEHEVYEHAINTIEQLIDSTSSTTELRQALDELRPTTPKQTADSTFGLLPAHKRQKETNILPFPHPHRDTDRPC